ncbi:hypothetical protein J3E68DRAFT_389734 [Trichoderma sp. SZMC 28012]
MELILKTGNLNPKKATRRSPRAWTEWRPKLGGRFSDSIERHQEGLRIFREECEQWEKREKKRHLFTLLASLASLVASGSALYCRYYSQHPDSC